MPDVTDPTLDPTSALLTEPTRVWDSPGAPNTSQLPIPGTRGRIRADITREYVAARPNQWYLNLVQVLPFPIDDVTQEFGADLYERILFDSYAAAAVTTFKAAVLEDGLSLLPAITDSTDPEYTQATTLLHDAERMFDDLDTDFDSWLWNKLDAMADGYKISEITYRIETATKPNGTQRSRYTLDALRVKPRRSVGFAVDTYRRIIGIMALIPGVGMPVYTGNVVISPSDQPNLLPRDKFAILTHRPQDEDPRGTSILRPAYTPWNLKMQLWGEYAKWLKQFASPSLVGYTAESAMQMPLVDPLGNPIIGTDGNPIVPTTPEEAMLNTLTQFVASSAAVFPWGAKVEPIEMRGQGQPFLNAFRHLNEEITTAIHGQTMTIQAPRYGTQALGNVQENTLETLVHQQKAFVVRMLRKDILRRWVRYNLGPEKEHLAPKCNLGQVEQADFTAEMDAFSRAGWTTDPSQWPGIDKRLNLPVRTTDPNAQQSLLLPPLQGQAGGMATAGRPPITRTAGSQQQEGTATPSPPTSTSTTAHAAALASTIRRHTGVILDPTLPPPPPTAAEQRVLAKAR